MATSKTRTKKVKVDERAEVEAKDVESAQVAEVENALSAIRLTDDEKLEVANKASEVMASIVEGSDNLFEEGMTREQLSGKLRQMLSRTKERSEQIQTASTEILNISMRNIDDTESTKTLNELRETVEKHTSVALSLQNAPTKILGFIPIPSIFKTKLINAVNGLKSAQTNIDELINAVSEIHNDGEKRVVDLKEFDFKLVKLSRDLKKELATYQVVQGKIKEFIEDMKERDPQKAEVLEEELLPTLLKGQQSTLEIQNQVQIARQQIGLQAKLQVELNEMMDKLSKDGKLALTVAMTVAVTAQKQKEDAEVIAQTRETIKQLQMGTAEQMEENAKMVKSLQESGVDTAKHLQALFERTKKSADKIKEIREQATKDAEKSIQMLTDQGLQLQKELDPLLALEEERVNKIRQVRENIGNVGTDSQKPTGSNGPK